MTDDQRMTVRAAASNLLVEEHADRCALHVPAAPPRPSLTARRATLGLT